MFVEQAEDGVTYAEKIAAEDRLLDPARPARGARARRCARCSPHVGARVALSDGTLLGVHRAALLRCRAAATRGAAPASGRRGVFEHDGRLLLGCTPGALELLRGAAARRPRDGRRVLPARSRAARPRVGASRSGGGAIPARRRGSGWGAPCSVASGITPAQTSQRVVLLVVSGGPVRILAEASSIGSASTAVAFSSFSLGGRTSPSGRARCVRRSPRSAASFSLGSSTRPRAAEQHHRAVVGRVVHRRAREHEAVDQRDGQARRRAGARAPAACGSRRAPWQ